MPYSRDALISELLSYYEFLVRFYLPPERLKLPPRGGWPSITRERFEVLRKNDTVLDLLKNIPYIAEKDDHVSENDDIASECLCIDYSGRRCQEDIVERRDPVAMSFHPGKNIQDDEEFADLVNPHSVALGRERCANAGYWIFCDTNDGYMTFIDFLGSSPRIRGAESAAGFFAGLKDDLTTLRRAPLHIFDSFEVLDPEVGYLDIFEKATPDDIRQIFRKHGWPLGDYQKQHCLAEIRQLFLEEDY